LIGDAGGFVNMASLQGTHLAMKTGMLAADAAFTEVHTQPTSDNLHMQAYHRMLQDSWVMQELKQVGICLTRFFV
jgi:electron-transferring-flavoprotein dehydrogenase